MLCCLKSMLSYLKINVLFNFFYPIKNIHNIKKKLKFTFGLRLYQKMKIFKEHNKGNI